MTIGHVDVLYVRVIVIEWRPPESQQPSHSPRPCSRGLHDAGEASYGLDGILCHLQILCYTDVGREVTGEVTDAALAIVSRH